MQSLLTLSTRNQIIIALLLVVLMVITRDHHFASMHNLPGASWAVFFLVGVYLRSAWPLLGFFALSWALDFAAYTWGGTSGFCLTPAYILLLPAYASLWLAGRWYAEHHQFSWRTFMPLSLSVASGLTLCELFSSGGFYFFSGRFTAISLVEFGERLATFFPMYVQSFLFYTGFVIAIHIALTLMQQQFNTQQHSAR